jgi:hypothetical protein
MSKRKITIIIIVLIILTGLAFLFFYFYKGKMNPTNNPGDTNTYSGFGDTTNNGKENNSPANISGTGTTGENGQVIDIKLKKVSTMPIAGFGIFMNQRYVSVPDITPPVDSTNGSGDTSTVTDSSISTSATDTTQKTTTKPKNISKPKIETKPAVRYVARATGNIYETFVDKINEQRFSSTVIPQIYDAYFNSNAQSLVMRYLNTDGMTIETFAGSLPKEVLSTVPSENNTLKGDLFSEGISDISLSPDKAKIFYLSQGTGSVSGITSGILGDGKSEVFGSPFTEWLSDWPSASMITLTTKPSGGLPGYMYAFDPAKQNLHKILSNINGLTTLTSPDGKSILYGNDNLSLGDYNMTSKNATTLSVRTMPEKCVWSSKSDALYCAVPKSIGNGLYPDDWYKGEVSFSDQIWKINVADGTASMLIDPISVPGGEEIDGTKLSLDKDENYLFFVNKKDSFLWELELN